MIYQDDLTERHVPMLRQALERDGELDPGTGIGAFWLGVLERPYATACDIILRHDGDDLLGVGMVFRRIHGRREGRHTMVWVPAALRRKGHGTALVQAVKDRVAAAGLGHAYACLYFPTEAAEGLLAATGFTLISDDHIVGWNGEPYSYQPVDGVRLELYRGGDPAMNAKIADLQNRVFVRELMVPTLTAERIEAILTEEGSWMLIATEEASGLLVGVCEGTDGPVIPSIAVAHSHWGTGLGQWMCGEAIDRNRAAGNERPWTLVRRKNRASLKLLERLNCVPVGECRFYIVPVRPGAAEMVNP